MARPMPKSNFAISTTWITAPREWIYQFDIPLFAPVMSTVLAIFALVFYYSLLFREIGVVCLENDVRIHDRNWSLMLDRLSRARLYRP